MSVVVVIRSTLGHLRDDSVVLVEIIERVEIVVLSPGLHVDPDLVLLILQAWPGPGELHTDVVVVVVVVRSLLGTDPAHGTPIETKVMENHLIKS